MVNLPSRGGPFVGQDGGPSAYLSMSFLFIISSSAFPDLLCVVLCLLTIVFVYQELFLGIGEGRGEKRKLFFFPLLFVFGYH